jgi:hypothetical protein
MGIYALEKPRGAWCPHAMPGRGCAVYDDRPDECRTFSCLWLLDDNLGPEWKPEKSKMVLTADETTKRTMVYVDTAAPDAWRKPPFHQRLMALMQAGLPLGRLVFIVVGERTGLLLPAENNEMRLEELGRLEPGDAVTLKRTGYPHATRYDAVVTRQG